MTTLFNSSAEGGSSSSKEQFDRPLDCPNGKVPFLVGVNPALGRAVIFRPRCKMWGCPVCGRANAWLWAYRANAGAHQLHDAGRSISFATITSTNKVSAQQSWWVARPAWMKLQVRIRREYGPYQYFLVPETQERGHVHYHGIFDVLMTTRWLKDNAASCGFGYQDDAKEVHDDGGVTAYIVKYLGKTLEVVDIPPRTRRVRTSRQWPKLAARDPPPDWFFQSLPRDTRPEAYRNVLEMHGYDVRIAGSKSAWMLVSPDDR